MRKAAGNFGGVNQIQAPFPGTVMMTQDEYHLLLEHAFTQSQRFVFAADEEKWFFIDPRNYAPGPTQNENAIIFQLPSISAAAGPILVDFYSDPTLGLATATPLTVPPFNRVGDSAIPAQLEFSSLDQAPDSLGSPISELLVPANATGSGQKTGKAQTELLPFKMDLTSPLLMVLTNQNGADTGVGVRHGWFEV